MNDLTLSLELKKEPSPYLFIGGNADGERISTPEKLPYYRFPIYPEFGAGISPQTTIKTEDYFPVSFRVLEEGRDKTVTDFTFYKPKDLSTADMIRLLISRYPKATKTNCRKTEINFNEMIQGLREACITGRQVKYANTNPHWWAGWNSTAGFWWFYSCCDLCDEEGLSDYFNYEKIQQFVDRHSETGKDSTWIKL